MLEMIVDFGGVIKLMVSEGVPMMINQSLF